MKKVKITVMRKASYPDLMAQYENPIEHACDVEEGAVFLCNGWAMPENFCPSAWETLSPFVLALRSGPGPRRRKLLRRLDEKPPQRHALLQRRLPPRQLPVGSIGRGRGINDLPCRVPAREVFYASIYCVNRISTVAAWVLVEPCPGRR